VISLIYIISIKQKSKVLIFNFNVIFAIAFTSPASRYED